MKARPILMNGDMVRAALREIDRPGSGKTQTRRVVKTESDWPQYRKSSGGHFFHDGRGNGGHFKECPYGQPGDLLWVRETWAAREHQDSLKPSLIHPGSKIYYPASPELGMLNCTKNRPSIFMPRWASRITLEITSVRVERLQEISEADARAEGIERMVLGGENKWKNYTSGGFNQWETGSFRTLWELLNGYESWEANPWVWVIEFQPHMCNVDDFIRAKSNG